MSTFIDNLTFSEFKNILITAYIVLPSIVGVSCAVIGILLYIPNSKWRKRKWEERIKGGRQE